MKLQRILLSPRLRELEFTGEFVEEGEYRRIEKDALEEAYLKKCKGEDEKLKQTYKELFEDTLKEVANCKKIPTLAHDFEYNHQWGLFSLKVNDELGGSVITGGISGENIRGIQVYGERCKESDSEHLFTRTLSGIISISEGEKERLVLEGTYAPFGGLEGSWRLESHPLRQIIR